MMATLEVGKIKVFISRKATADTVIPLDSIAMIALFAQHHRMYGPLRELNITMNLLWAVLLLLGNQDLSNNLSKLKDDIVDDHPGMNEGAEMGIAALLYAFSGLVANCDDRLAPDFLEEDTRLVEWIAKFLKQTKKDVFKPHLYTILADVAKHPKGVALLKRLDAHKLLYQGLTSNSVSYWTVSFVEKQIVRKRINTTETVGRGMMFLLHSPLTRDDLLQLGIAEKLASVMKRIPKSEIKAITYLSVLARSLKESNVCEEVLRAEKTVKAEQGRPTPYPSSSSSSSSNSSSSPFPAVPPSSLADMAKQMGSKCTHCKKSGDKCKLKKCGVCKAVQYCGRECQLADWKAGHKEECKKLSSYKQMQQVDKQTDYENFDPAMMFDVLSQYLNIRDQ